MTDDAFPFVGRQDGLDAFHSLLSIRAQVNALRLELLKIGVQVIASVRRLVLRLPAAFAYRDGWRSLALRTGAVPG